MFTRNLLAQGRARAWFPQTRNFAARTTEEVQGPAETAKQSAEGYFRHTLMWPLIVVTAVVGFVGYQYQSSFVNYIPKPKGHKSVDELKQESRNEVEFSKKLGQQIDKDRDPHAEKVWSKNTI